MSNNFARPARDRDSYAIEFIDVSRRFKLHHERRSSFQDWFIGMLRPRGEAEEFWALRDISFGVRRGETLGLIGRNGAGKSTLLKLVTRIIEPTTGRIDINGRVHAMLELGAGFHPELSGRDNVYLNGSIYGLSRREMTERFERIVAFAELERFIDTPVKHYSSGMFMRLGFSIAIHMDPEILVIDEVLAVGDAAFQERCYEALEALKARGTTILFVSHAGEQVRSFCDRAVLLQSGRLIDIGPAGDVVDHYNRLMHQQVVEASLLRVRPLDPFGQTLDQFESGDDLALEIVLRRHPGQTGHRLMLAVDLYDEDGAHLFGRTGEVPDDLPLPDGADGPGTGRVRSILRNLPVSSGVLTIAATLQRPTAHGLESIDRLEIELPIVAREDHDSRGKLRLEHTWDWETTATLLPLPDSETRYPLSRSR